MGELDFAGSGRPPLVRPDTIDPNAAECSIFFAALFRQIVMVVARFVKWSGAHIAVKPGQTPSTGYMRMLLFQHYAGRTPHMRRLVWSGKLSIGGPAHG
jgi:hypothetical protein